MITRIPMLDGAAGLCWVGGTRRWRVVRPNLMLKKNQPRQPWRDHVEANVLPYRRDWIPRSF